MDEDTGSSLLPVLLKVGSPELRGHEDVALGFVLMLLLNMLVLGNPDLVQVIGLHHVFLAVLDDEARDFVVLTLVLVMTVLLGRVLHCADQAK